MLKKIKKCLVEVYSRPVGFFRPTQQWNPGKQQEFRDRGHYKINGENYPFIEPDGFKPATGFKTDSEGKVIAE